MSRICRRIGNGELVSTAARREGVTAGQVRSWLASEPGLREAYDAARRDQVYALAERALSVADEPVAHMVAVSRNRIRVDAVKWLVSKIAVRPGRPASVIVIS